MGRKRKQLPPKAFHGCCEFCKHFSFCTEPCDPVRAFIDEGASTYEIPLKIRVNGKPASMCKPMDFHCRFSELLTEVDEDRMESYLQNKAEAQSPFRSYTYKNKTAGIFIDRFFMGYSYDDLAVKYDIDRGLATSYYHHAVNKLMNSLELLDHYSQSMMAAEEIKRDIPKGVKYTLMHHVLGIATGKIARITGIHSRVIRDNINRTLDRIAVGDIQLIEFTEQEREEARKRIEANRAYNRSYMKKRRSKNSRRSKRSDGRRINPA